MKTSNYLKLLSLLPIIAFAQVTPNVEWTREVGNTFTNSASPALSPDGEVVYFGNCNDLPSTLYAVNAHNGSLAWSYEMTNANAARSLSSAAVCTTGVIYMPVGDNVNKGALYAINPDGTEKWKFEMDAGSWINYTTPVIMKDGNVIVGNRGTNGAIRMIKASDGSLLSYNLPSGGIIGTIVVSQNNYAYTTSGNNGVFIYDMNTITDNAALQVAQYKVHPSTNYYTAGALAIDKDSTVIGPAGTGKVFSITPTGTANWLYPATTNLGKKIEQGGVAIGVDGTYYVSGSENNALYALNPDGTLKWEYSVAGNLNSVPAIDNLNQIHIADRSGVYYIVEDAGTVANTLYSSALTDGVVTTSDIWSSPAIADDGAIYITGRTDNVTTLFKLTVPGVTGPAKSPWPMKGGDAQRSGLQKDTSLTSDVEKNITSSFKTFTSGNQIRVTVPVDGEVTIYNIFGKVVAKEYVTSGESSFSLMTNQIYLIRFGNQTSKVIL